MLLLSTFLALCACTLVLGAPQSSRIVKVSQHGNGHYKTIGEALQSLPEDGNTYEIEIDAGVYNEQLVVNRTDIIMRGKTHGSHQKTTHSDNLVTIAWNQNTGDAYAGNSDEATSALVVNANNFKALNINFNQTWGLNFSGPQAVAVTVNGDKAVFDQCLFTSYQDTLFVGNRSYVSRQYFKDCYIAGAVDFIFGNASAYFDHCTIASNGPGHISAQKRQFNDEDQPIPSAFIFNGCNVVRDWDTNGVNITRKCDLGRPWRSYAKVVYMNSFIDDHIIANGWGNWYSSTLGDYSHVYYGEYNNTGPGSWEANAGGRTLNYTQSLNASEVEQYSLANWFKHDLDWTKTS